MQRQGGFTFLGLLAFVALSGVAMVAASLLWSTMSRREREVELLFVGEQYRAAIARYRERNTVRADRLPRDLSELLLDDTQVPPQRYLRKLFADPITGKRDWGLVLAPGGGILGVYSNSGQAPLKRAGFPQAFAEFASAKHYNEWRFIVPAEGSGDAGPQSRPPGGVRMPGGEALPGPPLQPAPLPDGPPPAPTTSSPLPAHPLDAHMPSDGTGERDLPSQEDGSEGLAAPPTQRSTR
jgi:type II secretory pathway pseudopilin PulG